MSFQAAGSAPIAKRSRSRRAFLAGALVSMVFLTTAAALAGTRLIESGSTLLYPLMELWIDGYPMNGDQVSAESSGSGKGIEDVEAGLAHLGASDAFLSDADLPHSNTLVQIPLVISAQIVAYNVPEVGAARIKLSGPVIAGIYDGSIQFWDDARVRALNPALHNLPHREVIPIHRSDGSGDTSIFTEYLSQTTTAWKKKIGFGKRVSWPAGRGFGSNGTVGVLGSCEATAYCIAYMGTSYLNRVRQAHLGYAALQNPNGQFILPNQDTALAAASSLASRTPKDGRLSLINAPGRDAYPIVNFEYAIVRQHQPDPQTAAALKRFLGWTISAEGGNAPEYLNQVYFVPLPDNVSQISKALIASIH